VHEKSGPRERGVKKSHFEGHLSKEMPPIFLVPGKLFSKRADYF